MSEITPIETNDDGFLSRAVSFLSADKWFVRETKVLERKPIRAHTPGSMIAIATGDQKEVREKVVTQFIRRA